MPEQEQPNPAHAASVIEEALQNEIDREQEAEAEGDYQAADVAVLDVPAPGHVRIVRVDGWHYQVTVEPVLPTREPLYRFGSVEEGVLLCAKHAAQGEYALDEADEVIRYDPALECDVCLGDITLD